MKQGFLFKTIDYDYIVLAEIYRKGGKYFSGTVVKEGINIPPYSVGYYNKYFLKDNFKLFNGSLEIVEGD